MKFILYAIWLLLTLFAYEFVEVGGMYLFLFICSFVMAIVGLFKDES